MAWIPCADALLNCWKAEYFSCIAMVLNAKEYATCRARAHPMRHWLPLCSASCLYVCGRHSFTAAIHSRLMLQPKSCYHVVNVGSEFSLMEPEKSWSYTRELGLFLWFIWFCLELAMKLSSLTRKWFFLCLVFLLHDEEDLKCFCVLRFILNVDMFI
jgi:hypothetical protein